ncbi:MAG TPA: hypothetical protein VHO47_02515 [Candidatus Babeliales bacterium]|nr:hypothetical protein [Candidatus Babeliales bacterium]
MVPYSFSRCKIFVLAGFILFTISLLQARSPFRTEEPGTPTIITHWLGDSKKHSLSSFYLQEGALFHLYDAHYFDTKKLTPGPISYRYQLEKHVDGTVLSQLIENLLVELSSKKPDLTDFTILKKRDFNFKNHTGFLVAKFKNYPFVLKLFITTPEQFLKPFDYGFESCCFFIMGGGVNRYLSGFTRLRNLDRLEKLVAQNSEWADKVEFPRKWYWEPQQQRKFIIEGENIGAVGKKQTITLPSVYALICDEVYIERTFSLTSSSDRETALKLTNFLQQQVDPHINNYVVDAVTKKIALVDTEHFPTMVGLDQPEPCTDYVSWYLSLSLKMWNNSFMRTKKQRLAHQRRSKQDMNFFSATNL